MTTLLSSVISLQLCTCPSASIGNLPIYPFRYHCYFGHRIAYERVQDALLPSFASHWGLYIVNIIISHYKEDLRAIRQISRSLSETGFSGFFNQTFPASFCESLIVVVDTIIYRTTIALQVFLPFHRWLGCLKNINIRNVSKHVVTHI